MIGKFQVLVVDDDPDKGHMLETALRMEGYEVHTATNGREALSAMESFQPDLVVSDVMMPELNGYELARQILEIRAPATFLSFCNRLPELNPRMFDSGPKWAHSDSLPILPTWTYCLLGVELCSILDPISIPVKKPHSLTI